MLHAAEVRFPPSPNHHRTSSIFRAPLKMVHDDLGQGAVVAAVLVTGSL